MASAPEGNYEWRNTARQESVWAQRARLSPIPQEVCVMKLTGRTALVTGGSRGIGRAIALALAQEGADVAINYVSSEPAAKEVAEQIRKSGRHSILARADVGDYPDTFRMAQDVLKEFGHLDILVNNAGINSDKTFVKMDHASWRKVLAINLD